MFVFGIDVMDQRWFQIPKSTSDDLVYLSRISNFEVLFFSNFSFLNTRRFWAETRNFPRPEITACNISFVPSVTRTGNL